MLEKSVENMLGKGAEKIGYAMGRDITDSAKEVLKKNKEFHFLRGQTMSVCIVALMVRGHIGSAVLTLFSLKAIGIFRLFPLVPGRRARGYMRFNLRGHVVL